MPIPITIDPIAVHLGALSIRWSALAYPATLIACAATLVALQRRERLLPEGSWPYDLCVWVAVGIVVGARLGEALLYRPGYFATHPFEILAIGALGGSGMASHGALLGAAIATAWFARRRDLDPWRLLDALALAAPWGLLFARLGNFVDGRPAGLPADVPWAIIHAAVDAVPRHPVQLYQAFGEGVLLFAVLALFPYRRYGRGSRAALACIAYGVIRIVLEAFKAPETDPGLVPTQAFGISNGQLYSLVLVAVGIAIALIVARRPGTDSTLVLPKQH